MGYASAKRILDVCGAAVLLVALSPLLLLIGLGCGLLLGRPVLFRQLRPGKDGVPFKLVKFRTMTDATDSRGELLPDGDRLTRYGKFLRATSLDELPELWNIILGQMSFVGPRPLLMSYLPLYSDEQRRRHDVRPGLTGLAQVRGRNATSWEERFVHDLTYIDNISLKLDLRILRETAATVVRREGVSQGGHATMPEFTG